MVQGPQQAFPPLLSRISKNLDPKWSNQDSNQHLYGMLAPQVVALHYATAWASREIFLKIHIYVYWKSELQRGETGKCSIQWFSPQMAAIAEDEWGQSQELHSSPQTGTGTQVLELTSPAFHKPLAHSWPTSGSDVIWTSIHMRCWHHRLYQL